MSRGRKPRNRKGPNDLLRQEREKRGWSQARLAELLGTTANVVSRWECGKGNVDFVYQEKLCELFGKNAIELGFLSSEQPKSVTHLRDEIALELESSDVEENREVVLQQPITKPQIIVVSSAAYPLSTQGNQDMNRRHALSVLSSVPLGLSRLSNLLHNEEILAVYAANVPIYWRLYFDGYIADVNSVLPECLSHLIAMASQPSLYQLEAASLASKASQLACMLALQDQNFGKALSYARQGFQYGQLAEDANLQVASLIRKALVYFYLKKPAQKLQAYQEAFQFEASVSPLLKGRVCMGLVEAYGNFGQEHEAKHFLDLGYKALPERPKEDPSFAYTHFSGYSRIFEGMMYLDLHQPKKGWEILTSLDKILPIGITSERVEFFVRRAKFSLALGDLKQSADAIETAISSAASLGSGLRLQETHDLYQEMVAKWPNERAVKDLADLFLV